jgi:hypothetical protein
VSLLQNCASRPVGVRRVAQVELLKIIQQEEMPRAQIVFFSYELKFLISIMILLVQKLKVKQYGVNVLK